MLHLHGSHGGHGAEVGTVSRYQGRLLLHQLGTGEERRVGPAPLHPGLAPLPTLVLGIGGGGGGAGRWRAWGWARPSTRRRGWGA